MIVSDKEIDHRLKTVWPELKAIWLTSREYWMPTLERVTCMIAAQPIRNLPYKPGKGECELFALALHAAIKTAWLYDPISESPIAFGEIRGMHIETSTDPIHVCNIAVTQQAVCLIEPQTYQYLKVVGPIYEDDPNFVFYVDM